MVKKQDVMGWLADEDFEVHLETPPQGAPVNWIIRAVSKIPVKANIILQEPREKPDRLVITLGVMVSDYHKAKMGELNDSERAILSYEILESLLSLCPDCLILLQPSLTDLQSIVITKILYEEEITRANLLSTVKTVVNMFSLLVLKLTSRFGPFNQPGKREFSSDSLSFI